jgi:hypothetical protein
MLPKLHKFRPICVPFQIATTYAPSLNIVSNLALIHALGNVHCTSNSIWRGSLHYAKSTPNHCSVKLRCLIINPIFKQPSIALGDLLGQIVHLHTCTKKSWKYIRKRPRTMVLSGLYLASTISLTTISIVKPSGLQKKLQEQGWT